MGRFVVVVVVVLLFFVVVFFVCFFFFFLFFVLVVFSLSQKISCPLICKKNIDSNWEVNK